MSEVSVTLKRTGRDEPWMVFRGDPAEIKKAMVEAFDLDAVALGYDLGSLTSVCQRSFNATYNAVTYLGAEPVVEGNESAPESSTNQGEESNPNAWVYDSLTAADTLEEVKAVWAANRSLFENDKDLDAAMKQRWAEIKESSK